MKAATQLGMSQSAANPIVKRLERAFGVPLLNRIKRNVAPTEAGGGLLASAGG